MLKVIVALVALAGASYSYDVIHKQNDYIIVQNYFDNKFIITLPSGKRYKATVRDGKIVILASIYRDNTRTYRVDPSQRSNNDSVWMECQRVIDQALADPKMTFNQSARVIK